MKKFRIGNSWLVIQWMILFTNAAYAFSQDYRLPFNGRWFVVQGGDTPNVNYHLIVPAQAYAIDFMKVGGVSQRELADRRTPSLTNYYSWGESVLSPVDGEVKEVANNLPDNPLGIKDPANTLGNHVIIEAALNRFVFIAHLQTNSVKVTVGQHVTAGQFLGLCGNSGNSDAPHIHMHVQGTPVFNEGLGQNMIFSHIDVELTGKKFENVDWPMIRGLFVENSAKH